MPHRLRPLDKEQGARISILANGVILKGQIRLFRQTYEHSHKPLADGAGHTFARAAERWTLMLVESIATEP